MALGDLAKKSISKTKPAHAMCLKNQPVRLNQLLYPINFYSIWSK